MKKEGLHIALRNCRARAADYLSAQALVFEDEHFWRHSPEHNPATHSEHLLYGTWAGVHASILLGLDAEFSAAQRRRIANALNSFQRRDGTYVMKAAGLNGDPDESEYLAFHCTNYALGAVRALGESPRYPLSFMERFLDRGELDSWLAQRDWQRPWAEGNNVVNLASFYAVLAEDGDAQAWLRLHEMAAWLERQQNAKTGFWHLAGAQSGGALLVAMAGAAHNLHLYYYLERDVPRSAAIVDSCLRLGYLGIQSACVDLDMADILTNMRRCHYRVAEIDCVLRRYLVELLEVQNGDGGFCDNYVTPHLQLGQHTPAGVSVTWTTWFRLTAIGMIVCGLFPEQRPHWQFRRTLGMGYWNANFALKGANATPGAEISHAVPEFTRLWLAAKRKQRFARQRLTSSLRQRLASGW